MLRLITLVLLVLSASGCASLGAFGPSGVLPIHFHITIPAAAGGARRHHNER